MSLVRESGKVMVRESGKVIVETISKQLEYVTKSLIAMQIILF